MLTKQLRIVTLCLLVALFVPMAASAAPMTSNQGTLPKAFSTGAYAANPLVDGISGTTGLPSTTGYRPILVQISNTSGARPHWNISEADIVYEMIYWGPAHTRYVAVYNDNKPELVGGVRSARVGHCSVRQEWDAPYVFWGGQSMDGTSVYDFFKTNNVSSQFLFDATGGAGTRSGIGGVFSRDSRRASPDDAIANIQVVDSQYWPTNEDGTDYQPRNHSFKFSSTSPSYGSDDAVEIYIPYDEKEYYPSYKYNATDRVYERFYNGAEQYDGQTEKRLVASNVIVQYADLTFFKNTKARPVVNLMGEGVMDAFIGGRHIRGSWQRRTLDNRTVFTDLNGEEITLLPGKTFIQIIPTSSSFTYIKADGTEMKMDFGAEVMPAIFDASESEEDINKME